ncbi:MAG: UPF0147 family protein [Candidatus Nanohaloarchaeota archaeon QJJ-9]|nr:UPF0147 family protein [Candidatus Nanohaloarchaeota archaeon QJJ-9]
MVKVEQVVEKIRMLQENEDLPSNVNDMLNQAIEALEDDSGDLSVRLNTVTSLLDQVSNDPNIAQHTRTDVWNIASMLESVEE